MAKVGKKYAEAAKMYDKYKLYEPAEAIDILKKMDTAKFDETVELAVNLNVDPKYADQQVRGALVLPHGIAWSLLLFWKPVPLYLPTPDTGQPMHYPEGNQVSTDSSRVQYSMNLNMHLLSVVVRQMPVMFRHLQELMIISSVKYPIKSHWDGSLSTIQSASFFIISSLRGQRKRMATLFSQMLI